MEIPISGVPFEYLLDFYKVGRGLVPVDGGPSGPTYGFSDEHKGGVVVLVLRGLESDPVNARYRATAWNLGGGRTKDWAGGVGRGLGSDRCPRHIVTA